MPQMGDQEARALLEYPAKSRQNRLFLHESLQRALREGAREIRVKAWLLEVESALDKHPKRTSKHNPEVYIGGGQSKLRYIGLRVPHLQQTFKAGFSFSDKDSSAAWDYIWKNSDCYEVMALALNHFEQFRADKKRGALLEAWPRLKQWSSRIDNWAHSDSLSGIYACILEANPKLVYPTLEKWNASRNPWLRRLSIVSLLFYSSQRKKALPFAKIIRLVEPLLEDEHYYVQKGVGWTLREAGNLYPEETYAFLEKNIRRLSAAAFSSSTEKLARAKKERLKGLRKRK
jgi:3-methyladenine DNA glycosylase AlkD